MTTRTTIGRTNNHENIKIEHYCNISTSCFILAISFILFILCTTTSIVVTAFSPLLPSLSLPTCHLFRIMPVLRPNPRRKSTFLTTTTAHTKFFGRRWILGGSCNTDHDHGQLETHNSVLVSPANNDTYITKLPLSTLQPVTTLLAVTTLNLLGPALLAPLNPNLSTHFCISQGSAHFGSLTSAYPLGTLLGLCLWPGLSDSPRVGRKVVLIIGLTGTTLGLACQQRAIAKHWSLGAFLITRIWTGCFAGSAPVVKAYLSDAGRPYASSVVGRFLAWRDAASTLAFIIGPTLGGMLFEMASSRSTSKGIAYLASDNSVSSDALAFVVGTSALANLVAAGLVIVLVKDTAKASWALPWRLGDTHSSEKSLSRNGEPHINDIMTCLSRTRLRAGISTVCSVTFLYHVADSTLFAFLPVLLQTQVGMDARTVGLTLTSCASLSFALSACSLSNILMSRYGMFSTCVMGLGCVGMGLLMLSSAAAVTDVGVKTTGMVFGGLILYFCGVPVYGPSVNMMLLKCVCFGRSGKAMGTNAAINMFARVMTPVVIGEIYRIKGAAIAFRISSGAAFLSICTVICRRYFSLRELHASYNNDAD